jgi:hypothetical protein
LLFSSVLEHVEKPLLIAMNLFVRLLNK